VRSHRQLTVSLPSLQNPTPEFLVRFYQAGAFMPFFRAHAHIDTKRREPYLLEEPFKGYVRDMLRLRYSLLPVWYTAFREAAVDGTPVIRYAAAPQSPFVEESSIG
jgi:alpha 1,3-glucosidase